MNGPCEIRILESAVQDDSDRDAVDLELYFYDEKGEKIINESNPLVMSVKYKTGRLKLIRSVMLGELSEEGFALHEETLKVVAPGINWQTAEAPSPATMPDMNPIKPPPRPTPGGS